MLNYDCKDPVTFILGVRIFTTLMSRMCNALHYIFYMPHGLRQFWDEAFTGFGQGASKNFAPLGQSVSLILKLFSVCEAFLPVCKKYIARNESSGKYCVRSIVRGTLFSRYCC